MNKLTSSDFDIIKKLPASGFVKFHISLTLDFVKNIQSIIIEILNESIKNDYNLKYANMSEHSASQYNDFVFIIWYNPANGAYPISWLTNNTLELTIKSIKEIEFTEFLMIKETSLNRGHYYNQQFNL